MSETCRKFLFHHVVATILCYGACVQFFYNYLNILSFTFGLMLYLGNLVLLALVIDRFFQRAGSVGSNGRFPSKLLVIMAPLKMGFLASGLYVGLVWLKLNASQLVSGAVLGLVVTTAVGIYERKKKLFSFGKLR